MRVVLDAGALIAIEQRPAALALVIADASCRTALVPRVPATVLAQVWRGGAGRQALLAPILADLDVDPLNEDRARTVGRLLAASDTSDIADAHVVDSADSGDVVFTSDPFDIARLARAASKRLAIVTV